MIRARACRWVWPEKLLPRQIGSDHQYFNDFFNILGPFWSHFGDLMGLPSFRFFLIWGIPKNDHFCSKRHPESKSFPRKKHSHFRRQLHTFFDFGTFPGVGFYLDLGPPLWGSFPIDFLTIFLIFGVHFGTILVILGVSSIFNKC